MAGGVRIESDPAGDLASIGGAPPAAPPMDLELGGLGQLDFHPQAPLQPPAPRFQSTPGTSAKVTTESPQRQRDVQRNLVQAASDTERMKGPTPRGSKTQLALHFAKAMGYEIPGEVDSPDELAFAKAAHSALLKMTKGMTVARFLASHQSPKTRDLFGKYLDAELAKGRQTPAPSSRQAPTSSGKTPPKNEPRQSARLPLQPI